MKRNKEENFFNINKKDKYLLCLAGNPNTGKSSIFNVLTNLKQHTGNWPGKTISNARGEFRINDKEFILVDVPGTYSLFGLSEDEIVARDFICFGKSDLTLVITAATSLERDLNLVFQILEYSKKVIVVVNLMDEARKKKIEINKLKLIYKLGVPVVFTSAKTKEGIDDLKRMICDVIDNKILYQPIDIKYDDEIENEISKIESQISDEIISGEIYNKRVFSKRIIDSNTSFLESLKKYSKDETYTEFKRLNTYSDEYKKEVREKIISINFEHARDISSFCVKKNEDPTTKDRKIDKILTSKIFGIPIMIGCLALIFYLTIQFANYPSFFIYNFLFSFEDDLLKLFNFINLNEFIRDLIVLGIYRTVAWVTSVMLPPMAIFYSLFTLLEDLGYLPRVAFNMDNRFKKSCAHGKQCLTMCMGFGCNASGVTGCRIIDSPREKLIAIITNTFVPCNGRFPTIIAISTSFFAITTNQALNGIIPTIVVTLIICLGVFTTLIVSKLLSKTILKGNASSFTLELPPYRKPNILRVIYTSLIDRTIFLLGRAIKVAAPFGGIIWILANTYIDNNSIIHIISTFLDPISKILGFDGVILLAFILALPANEILLPIIIMSYCLTGKLTNFDTIDNLKTILVDNGWTLLTAINVLLFSLLHWPCSTTLLTIKKETGSLKYTFLSFIIPTVIGILVCITTNILWNIFV